MQSIKRLIIIFLTIFIISCSGNSSDFDLSTEVINLADTEWKLSFEDKPEFSSTDIDDSGWEKIDIPLNLRSKDSSFKGSVWLRKTIDLNPEAIHTTLALTLGKIYDRDETYLNGVIIGINGKRPDDIDQNEHGFGRLRVYPIPTNGLVKGKNTIAVKITSNLRAAQGILQGPVGIATLSSASSYLVDTATDDIAFVSIFLFVGILFLIDYLKMKDMREYLYFSLFIVVFSTYEFSKNEFRFEIVNNFVLFKGIEYFTLINIPFFHMRFLFSYFKYDYSKYLNYYFFGSFFLSILLCILPFLPVHAGPVQWNDILSFWLLSLPPVLIYALYVIYLEIRKNNKEALIYIIAYLYFIYSITKEVFVERGWLSSPSTIDRSLLIYVLFVTTALRLRFILLKLSVLNRFETLKEVDKVREKVFLYMNRLLSLPLKEALTTLRSIKSGQIKGEGKKEQVEKIQIVYDTIKSSVDDILELSSVETMKEVPHKETVTFVDFIKHVLTDSNITYDIKVDPEFKIHNSLDLIISLIIRLIHFPGFKDFNNIDLIITSDLKNHLHFRFMLYHKNPKFTKELYKVLSDTNVSNIQAVRWVAIKETLRLLNGNLEIGLINKKYLRIDFELEALPLEKKIETSDISTKPLSLSSRLKLPSVSLENMKSIFPSKKKEDKPKKKESVNKS